MNTLIENVSLLYGSEFQLIEKGWIQIEDGWINYAGERKSSSIGVSKETFNGRGLLAIPGLINAHTHIGDSIAKDIGIGSTLCELVHPIYGLKSRILREAKEEQLRQAITETTFDMLACGITTFADFREGGLKGVSDILNHLPAKRPRAIILCRPNHYFTPEQIVDDARAIPPSVLDELSQALNVSDGLGLSGPDEYTGKAMEQMSQLAKSQGKLVAIHAAESRDSQEFSLNHFSETEVKRVLRYMKPNFLVHLTNSTEEELIQVSGVEIPVVCCPRTNSILGLGFPPIMKLLQFGGKVALGTDNVMLNAPDMFREMDYTSRTIRAIQHEPDAVSSKDILKMATINAAEVLGLGSTTGSLQEGKRADITFLNLNSPNLNLSKDLITSVVHRARSDNVECVIVDGQIVHGSLART
jgi:cytosine/adenosine deaminase-related metal-dependent hydrolase